MKNKYLYNELLTKEENDKIIREMDLSADDLLKDMDSVVIDVIPEKEIEKEKLSDAEITLG
jgi:hypothetical protein